jgi:hypothetical protein
MVKTKNINTIHSYEKCMQNKKIYNSVLKRFMFIIALVCFLQIVTAQDSLGVFEKGDTVRLMQTCSSCSYVTIDSLKFPNSTILFINENMTKSGSTFYYDFSETNLLGRYIYNTYYGEYSAPVYFDITGNGKDLPDGFLSAFFSILYIAFFGVLIYIFVYSLGHFLKLDFDLIDLAYSFGMFFSYLTLFFLSKYYIGNDAIEGIMELFLYPLGLLLLVVPLIMFVISITVGALKPNQSTYGTRRFRRSKL